MLKNHACEKSQTWAALNWNAPWMVDFQALGRTLLDNAQNQIGFHEKLNAAWHHRWPWQFDSPIFVPQSDLPKNRAYENHIFEYRRIPTRENWHDFLNALVWLHFPGLKTHLNALQNRAIIENQQNGITQRGRVRDAVTVLDENGAFFLAPHILIEALKQRQWQRLFVDLRDHWKNAHLIIVGHALLEQLIYPRKNLCAHVLTVALEDVAENQNWDALFAADERLQYDVLKNAMRKPFVPLPVLGVPGWCADNENPQFYADLAVFRPFPSSGF